MIALKSNKIEHNHSVVSRKRYKKAQKILRENPSRGLGMRMTKKWKYIESLNVLGVLPNSIGVSQDVSRNKQFSHNLKQTTSMKSWEYQKNPG